MNKDSSESHNRAGLEEAVLVRIDGVGVFLSGAGTA